MGLAADTTLTQCQANNVAAPTAPLDVGPPASDKAATSPGISGQTAPPAPVAPSSQPITLSQLEANARQAVDAFIAEKYQPASGRDHDQLVRILKNSAVCAAEANLDLAALRQLTPPNPEKLSAASRLVRQAQETLQGQAETREDIGVKRISKIFAMEQALKKRCDKRPVQLLTPGEKREIIKFMQEVYTDALAYENDWKLAYS